MAVIYVPQDPRQEAWKQIIHDLAMGIGNHIRQKKLNDLINSGETDPMKLMEAAGSDPDMQAQVKNIIEAQRMKKQEDVQQYNLGLSAGRTNQEIETSKAAENADAIRAASEQQQMQQRAKLLPLQLQAQQAEIAQRRAEASKVPSEIAETQLRTRALQQQIDQAHGQNQMMTQVIQQLLGPGGTSDASTPAGSSTPTTQTGAAATDTGAVGNGLDKLDRLSLGLAATEKGPSGFVSELNKIQKQQETVNNLKPLPTQIVNSLTGTAALTNDLNEFLDHLPQIDTGGFAGKVQKLGQEYGIDTTGITGLSTGDKDAFNAAAEIMDNMKQNAATSGSGFLSKERIELAQSIQPGPMKDRYTNLISTGVSAASQLARLLSYKQNYTGVTPKYNTANIDNQIDNLKRLVQRVDQFYSDPKTGAVVDMEKLDSIVPDSGLKTLSGKKITRDDVKQVLIQLQNKSGGTQGITPEAVVQQLLKNY